jgi:methylenetetrahydrofolate reductase (NADPH)
MSLLPFLRRKADEPALGLGPLLAGWSIEVMPRTAEKVGDFRALLPPGTRVYVAHIDGTAVEDMVRTAARIAAEGFPVMPHIPARSIPSRAALADLVARYRGEAGVTQALLLAGGRAEPLGELHSSIQLAESGLFDGFERVHFAGHPEGNRDIDPKGDANQWAALRWKSAWARGTEAEVALATQFCFAAGPVLDWAGRLQAEGIGLPVHVGIAGPAKLQTLIKYALACGVGPSLQVLQKRAMDVTKLLLPYEPDEVVAGLAAGLAARPDLPIAGIHIFPLGGLGPAADWARARSGPSPLAASA